MNLPLGFWVCVSLLAALSTYAWKNREQGWGIPAIAVYGTVAVWYLGDAIYNGYDGFIGRFSPDVLAVAWLQIAGFLISFTCFVPPVNAAVNSRYVKQESQVLALIKTPNSLGRLQDQLEKTLYLLATVWLLLTIIGLAQVEFDWQGVLAPWLGHRIRLFGRGRIGGGADFLYSAAQYLLIFCQAGFGLVAALVLRPRIRTLAIILIFLSWPYVLLGTARNTMLAIILPGLVGLVFLRLHRRPIVQVTLLAAAFLALHFWFLFVLANRSSRDIADAFASRGAGGPTTETHGGLNMLEELCHINTFLQQGAYAPNWGYRYFADAVNPIPRAIWPGKPTIGLDYAVARGQGAWTSEGVHATVSTGMIGQGVVNFGAWAGPPAAALLMALWVAVLARFDLTGYRLGRVPLYLLGVVLTFNLGRDITFLVAYPLIFGYVVVWALERRMPASASWSTFTTVRRTSGSSPTSPTPPRSAQVEPTTCITKPTAPLEKRNGS
jgi:hypothetical protein